MSIRTILQKKIQKDAQSRLYKNAYIELSLKFIKLKSELSF